MRYILVVVVAAALINGCSKPGPKQTKYIPKDAYVVVGFNGKNIFEKIGKANISFDSVARALSNDDSSITKAVGRFNDLKNSGVDFNEEAFFFVKNTSGIMTGQSQSIGVVAALKDVSAFEKFIKKQNLLAEIKKGDNYSYLPLGDDYIAGWNDNVMIIAMRHAGTSSPGSYATGEGTLSQQMLTALFAQKESESIASVDGFNDVAKENADMMFFATSALNQGSMSFLDMTKLADLTKGAYSTGTANFEDGKIVASFTSHNSDAMADLLKKYPSKTINLDMLDKYPSTVNAFAVASFDAQVIPGVLKYAGMDALANQSMQQAGLSFTLDDVVKAFKGDFAIVASDFGVTQKTMTEYGGIKLPQPVTTTLPTYKILFNAAIGDKASYDKVVSGLTAKGIMTEQNGQYVFGNMNDMGGIVMKSTGKNFYVATDNDLITQYDAGTSGKTGITSDIHDKIKGQAFALYFDINSILKVIPAEGNRGAALDTAKTTFKDFLMTAGNFDGKTSKGLMELRLLNDKENSLVTFARFLISEGRMDKERRMNGMMSLDTLKDEPLPPPPAK